MIYKKVLVDTNICIDAALYRKPYASDALRIFELSQFNKLNAMIAAHSFDTIFYILRKSYSVEKRYTLMKELRAIFKVAPVTQTVIDEALGLKWPDFEDAIHYRAAVTAGCDAIVTRNPADFKDAELTILSPLQLLAEIEEER
ncbi:MAG: PIN domain-containing protein [Balneolaceae bacterium]|nr:PIN domain-containing protein [Balneolaceae bacterium]